MKKNKLDIIIPTIYAKFNENILVDLCVESIKQNTDPKRINILVCEGSAGFAKTINKALQETCNDVILFNDDILITDPDWLDKLESYPGDVKGCKLLYPDGTIQHAGGILRRDGAGINLGQDSLDLGQFDQVYEPVFVCFAATYIARRVIDKIGLLDEQFTVGYYEDGDYCLRAKAAGFKVNYVPVPIIHLHSKTTGSLPNLREILRNNHGLFLKKWFEIKNGRLVLRK